MKNMQPTEGCIRGWEDDSKQSAQKLVASLNRPALPNLISREDLKAVDLLGQLQCILQFHKHFYRAIPTYKVRIVWHSFHFALPWRILRPNGILKDIVNSL